MLADRGTMRAARVGENDVALDQLGQILQVVDPRAGRLNPAQRLGRTQEIGGWEPVEHVRVADLRCQLLRRRDLHDPQPFDLEVVQQREMRRAFRLRQHDFHWLLPSPLSFLLNTVSGIARHAAAPIASDRLLPARTRRNVLRGGYRIFVTRGRSRAWAGQRQARCTEAQCSRTISTVGGLTPMVSRSRPLPAACCRCAADGVPAMLKVATEPEERRGADTMIWWGGDGAAHVLAHEGDALLMERAMGQRRWSRWRRTVAMTRRAASSVPWPPDFMPRDRRPAPVVARAVAGVVRRA